MYTIYTCKSIIAANFDKNLDNYLKTFSNNLNRPLRMFNLIPNLVKTCL